MLKYGRDYVKQGMDEYAGKMRAKPKRQDASRETRRPGIWPRPGGPGRLASR